MDTKKMNEQLIDFIEGNFASIAQGAYPENVKFETALKNERIFLRGAVSFACMLGLIDHERHDVLWKRIETEIVLDEA